MKKLLLFAVGFLIFAVSVFFMFSRPYTKTIIHRGTPVEITLYQDFYIGLPYWLLGVTLMFTSFVYEKIITFIQKGSTIILR